jgi:hypothetical protein
VLGADYEQLERAGAERPAPVLKSVQPGAEDGTRDRAATRGIVSLERGKNGRRGHESEYREAADPQSEHDQRRDTQKCHRFDYYAGSICTRPVQ